MRTLTQNCSVIQWVLDDCEEHEYLQKQGSYGHSWTASKCLPCCWWADGSASVDHCSGGCPCSFHCQDPPGDTCKLYYVLNGLLVLTWIQNHHVAEIKSNRWILISLNFTTDVKQHHKTGDHETHQRTTERGLTEGWRPLSYQRKWLFRNIPGLMRCSCKCHWGCRKRRNSSDKF